MLGFDFLHGLFSEFVSERIIKIGLHLPELS